MAAPAPAQPFQSASLYIGDLHVESTEGLLVSWCSCFFFAFLLIACVLIVSSFGTLQIRPIHFFPLIFFFFFFSFLLKM